MPEEDNLQSIPATDTAPIPSPETPSVVSAEPESATNKPIEASSAETQTAQIPPNEPIPAQSESIVPAPAATQPEPPIAPIPVILTPVRTVRDLLAKARMSIQDRKRKKRDKIMNALLKKNKITNDEVEKLLHVSDATATRYLSALEKEGKIQRVGKTGTGVVYSKI